MIPCFENSKNEIDFRFPVPVSTKPKRISRRRTAIKKDLTKKAAPGILPLVSFEQRSKPDIKLLTELFSPLQQGKSVALFVTDPRLPKKARVKNSPILLLAPLELFGGASGKLVCSLQAYGCEIIDMNVTIQAMSFSRLGLTATLAAALAEALNEVLHGDYHGNNTNT
jgi:hypothetical protein